MKAWTHTEKDTKRVKILKNIAAKLQEEINEYATKPLNENPWTEKLMQADLVRLNNRIKKATAKVALENQLEIDFSKKKRKRKIRNGKMYVKIAK